MSAIRRALSFVLSSLLCSIVTAQVDVLTQHNDIARTGANLQETVLKPAGLKDHLHKLAFRLVDGNVYAQPLIAAGMKVAGRTNPVDVAIVATEHNSVYAFDASDIDQASTTAQLWHTDESVLGKHLQSRAFYQDIGIPECSDITTEIGITSTPVIKITNSGSPREGIVFAAAKSKSGADYAYKLFALSLADGSKLGELEIAGEVPGSGNGSTGSGANKKQEFDPKLQLNRPGLLLIDNTLYIAFGGHCDQGDYHGWLFACDVSDPAAMKISGIFCSTPNGKGDHEEGRAGIWMSGQGASADADGNIYVVTGDGTFDASTMDLGDSVVRLKFAGGSLQADDWFTPQNQDFLKKNDVDLGSSGAVLVPNSHLLITGGKEGRMYLIDRSNMGKGATMSLRSFIASRDPDLPGKHFYNIHGTPVIWTRADDEMYVYLMAEEDHLKQYKLVRDAANGWKFDADTPFKSSKEVAPYPNFPDGLFGKPRDAVWMPGGFCSISANGQSDGIVWVTMPFAASANHAVVRGVLRAFDASDISGGELWDSEATGDDNDRLGQFAKFCPPTIANGKVYVATFQEETVTQDGVHHKAANGDQPALVIYGLR